MNGKSEAGLTCSIIAQPRPAVSAARKRAFLPPRPTALRSPGSGGADSEDSTSSLQVEPHSGTWLHGWTMGSNYGEWRNVGAT